MWLLRVLELWVMASMVLWCTGGRVFIDFQVDKKIGFIIVLIASCHGASQQFKKKATEGLKRAVETYSYPAPTERFEENSGNGKSKVIVETIKSISPSEYLTSTGYLGSTIEASTAKGKIPVGTVTYNAFEPETTKKVVTAGFVNTETSTSAKNKSSYRHYTGGGSSSQNPTNSPSSISSTVAPASVRTTSVEPATTLLPGYHYLSQSSNFPQSSASGESAATEKSLKIITTRGKAGLGRYTLQKIVKKPTKIEPKISDSKPEETGFNGYHYDVGSLGFEAKHSGSQGGGMMGASYMRSSSPYYNYHVMLD